LTLYIIGVGLEGAASIQQRALAAIKECSSVFIETYTSGSRDNLIEGLEKGTGKKIILLPREKVEQSRIILNSARTSETAFLVQGDALTATTHNQVRFDALDEGINVVVMENSSIITAVPGYLGLEVYKMGQVVSLPFVTEKFFPRSPYDKILGNLERGLHTLILLDITETGYMSVAEACSIIRRMNNMLGGKLDLSTMKVAAVHAYGTSFQTARYGTMEKLCSAHYTENPSTLVIPGKLDYNEEEFISHFDA
jgi:diphthine synthase